MACSGFPGGFLPCFVSSAKSEKIADEKIKNRQKKTNDFKYFFCKNACVLWCNMV